ncbi:hypothetical protein B0H11DRAFT_1999798 [Mycena galericulata]|nr:hypothetical protein B0H11DRAFT_1999798 [Mycena galericulata]
MSFYYRFEVFWQIWQWKKLWKWWLWWLWSLIIKLLMLIIQLYRRLLLLQRRSRCIISLTTAIRFYRLKVPRNIEHC